MTESWLEIPQQSFTLPSSSPNDQPQAWEEMDPKALEIERLKKDNFNLRLRVFHLEGCLGLQKDSSKHLEKDDRESKLVDELYQELEKKDQLLLSARDLIQSLKKELTETTITKCKEDTIENHSSLSVEQLDARGAARKEGAHSLSVEEREWNADRNDIADVCRNVADKLDYLMSGQLRDDWEKIYSSFQRVTPVQWSAILQFLAFIDNVFTSILQGEYSLHPKLDSHQVQTDSVVTLPNDFISNLVTFLKYLVGIRLKLQGIIQGDETSQPVFPDVDDAFVGDELLKLLSNEIVDWEQLVDQIQLQKEEFSLTYDALAEAESLRDEAIEALEATEAERDAALKFVETLKELALSTASSDVVATERILEEIAVESSFGSNLNEWRANILHQVMQQYNSYHQLENDLEKWQRRFERLACDESHELLEDGTFTCFLKEEKDKLEQRITELLEASKEEQEAWSNKYEALKEERDVEMMRYQELEDESMRMIEEQVELHKKQMRELEDKLAEKSKYEENLEQQLKDTYDIMEYCEMKTSDFLDGMERLEDFLLSLDKKILESVEIDRINEEVLADSRQVISKLKQKITCTEKEILDVATKCHEQERELDSTYELLDSRVSHIQLQLTESNRKIALLRKELFERTRKIEEQENKILILQEQIRERDLRYEGREEEHRKEKAVLEEEKVSAMNELSFCREEYQKLENEWVQLCDQVEDITSALEQHETFSKHLEEEKETFKLGFYRVDEDRKLMDCKYQRLYSLHCEVKESLLREIRLWKTQFSSYREEYIKLKETWNTFQELVGSRWSDIVFVLQRLYGLLLNRILFEGVSFESMKPLEFQGANSFDEFVNNIDVLCENIQLICEELESGSNIIIKPFLERHFTCQSQVIFSTDEQIYSFLGKMQYSQRTIQS